MCIVPQPAPDVKHFTNIIRKNRDNVRKNNVFRRQMCVHSLYYTIFDIITRINRSPAALSRDS